MTGRPRRIVPHRIVHQWRRLGVRTRLMAVHITVLTVAIGAIVVQSNHIFSARQNSEFNRSLTEEGPEFTDAAAGRPRGQSLRAFTVAYLTTHARSSKHGLVIALLGHAAGTGTTSQVFSSSHAHSLAANHVVTSLLASATRSPTLTGLSVGDTQYRVFATPIAVGGRRVGTLVALRNLAELNAARRSALMVALLEGVAALIAAVLAGYLLLRRVLRVVSDVTGAAEHAAGGDLTSRLEYDGPDDEVGHLARTVDAMLARLDGAFAAQRRLLSDVSHQLRTPLTVIRGHLEVLARTPAADADERAETIAVVVDELEHVSLMVERLLLLGRALEPDFIEEEPIEVRSLLTDVVDAAEHLAPRRWELEADDALVVRGDRTKLRGVLLNLVDNAVNATEPTDTIRVAALDEGQLVLEVADTGRGMPVEDQQRLFERFSRATSGYRGSGLGLAIVKAVAEAHGGKVELNSAPGEGCRVRIVLPRERVTRIPVTEAVAG